MGRRSLLLRLLLLAAASKAAGGLAAYCLTAGNGAGDPAFPYPLYLCYIAAFGGGAALLLLGGSKDRRAVFLGGLLLAVATAYCNAPLRLAAVRLSDAPAALALALYRLDCTAFAPYFLWAFTRDFPQPAAGAALRRATAAGTLLSAGIGALLFGASLVQQVVQALPPRSAVAAVTGRLAALADGGFREAATLPLLAAALPFMFWKAARASGDDQRRSRLLLWAVGAGCAPILLEVLAGMTIPAYGELYSSRPWLNRMLSIATAVPALTVPFTSAYAVLVHRVMEVRMIARRALQYALARYSAILLAAVPIAGLCGYAYWNREISLEQLFSRPHLLLLIATSAAGVATLSYRKRLLEWIDRRFFRERYDARQILSNLVERIRATCDGPALAKLIARELDLALHVESVAFMIVDPRTGLLVDPRDRGCRLDASSSLAHLISNGADPLPTDLEDPRSPLARLPEQERHWLVDKGLRLIVPILALDGSLLGVIGLGEKKSGEPFLKEDRQLLRAIASSAAWVLELEQSRSSSPRFPASPTPDSEAGLATDPVLSATRAAKECARCGILYQSYAVFCTTCSRRLDASHLPYVLPGKFRFEQRLGTGGMGVVYRGTDLALGRPVAVKTMRRVSPEDAMRLRREARTAAAVAHPHLASVYGIETWQGTPMVILELLEGGTLAHRIEREKLPPLETVDLGIAMAEALAQLHAGDILHRDIKPSNIGYARDGTPKLMDFGIARAIFDLRRDRDLALAEAHFDHSSLLLATSIWSQTTSETPTSVTLSQQLAGTLSYLSPEALDGRPADASFDLWSLAIVLYECLLGRKVFGGSDVRQIMSRIRLGRVPDFAQVCPDYDSALGDFFRAALHRTLSRRPADALDFKHRLAAARGRLAA